MQFDGNLHLHAHRITNLAERLDPQLDLLGRDVLAIRRICELIERPDLHGGNAHIEKLASQLSCLVALLPLEQIFEGALVLANAPAFGERTARLMGAVDVVTVPGAGVVQADPVTNRAAEQTINW